MKKKREPSAKAGKASGGVLELEPTAAILANVLIIGTWTYAAVLRDVAKDFYYMSAQEDEYLEWGTFWAFIFAAVICVLAGVYQRRASAADGRGRVPWFLFGVAAFCVVVAMEEISWGQRVLAYRPPVYFLEHNFQQELNFHNVMSTGARKMALKSVILGYGVALPLLALFPAAKRFLVRAGVVVPPLALAPSFVATFILYQRYDGFEWLFEGASSDAWSFTGEWVELMLGLGFLFSAIAAALAFRGDDKPARGLFKPLTAIGVSWLLVVAAGVGNAAASRHARGAAPEVIETARGELEALKRDFSSGRVTTKCNRHRRLYTFKEKYDQDALLRGEFASLTAQGLPEERAEFFLDPWNSPYWIRDRCDSDDDRRIVFVYSFGPNRLRDSSRWEILGDDVGTIIYDGRRVRDFIRQR